MSTNWLYLLLKSARPQQWLKNLSLFAALIFSGFFFYNPPDALPYFVTVGLAFIVFSVLTSSVYIINDLIDYEADRQHPFKRRRPIASGKLPKNIAMAAAILGVLVVFLLSFSFSIFFQLLIVGYLLLQILYATTFKHIAILDVVSIATGFLIRIYAGAVVVNLHMSVWFLLTVISASLFLAVGKRQSERTLMKKMVDEVGTTRKALKRYSERLLDQYTGMFANATWLTYALFAFQDEGARPDPQFANIYSYLPSALQSQKLLMLSLPFVILGIMRYLQLVYESNKGESPEKVLLTDKPLLTTAFLFGVVVMLVLYVFA